MQYLISHQKIIYEEDIVLARQQSRRIAELLGVDRFNCSRITTAVFELCRNAHQYAGGDDVFFGVDLRRQRQHLIVEVVDQGTGIPEPEKNTVTKRGKRVAH